MRSRFSPIIAVLLLWLAPGVPALAAADDGGAGACANGNSAIDAAGKDPLARAEEEHEAAAQRFMAAHHAIDRELFGSTGRVRGPKFQAALRDERRAYADLTRTGAVLACLRQRHDDTPHPGVERAP